MSRFSYLTVVIIGSFGFITAFTCCKKQDKATVAGPVRVEVAVAGAGEETNNGKNYSGTVESADVSTVSFSVPGTITAIYVEEGQKVGKGQLLAKVKSESLVNSSNIAQAELEEARDAYQRLKKLHDAKALPDIKWVEIQAKLKQAENAAALANRAVSDASLHSPISGYVSEKLADVGQTVIAAQPVLKVVNINDLQVAISVPENDISSFSNGATATITFGTSDSIKVTGRMVQKGVVADPLTRSYTVKFDIGNPGGKILPGMIGSVVVKDAKNESTDFNDLIITLPSQSVLLDSDNRQFVWVVKDGKAKRQFVVADELSIQGVNVKSGISKGDSIIIAGMQKISTGTKVTVVK